MNKRPDPDEVKAKVVLQKKSARAPKVPAKVGNSPKPPETGKPLWDRPHSR